MQSFFVHVLIAVFTNEKVLAAIERVVKNAVAEATDDIYQKLDDIQSQAVDRVDAMDGKMGNLQEQLAAIPGQVVNGVINGVREAIEGFNPFRPR